MPDYSLSPIFEPQLIAGAAAALQFAPAGAGTVVPANTLYRIITARVINVSALPVALQIWRIPSGGSLGISNEMVAATVIIPVANNTFPHFDLTVLWGATLRPGDSIQAQAGAANSLTIVADGAVVV